MECSAAFLPSDNTLAALDQTANESISYLSTDISLDSINGVLGHTFNRCSSASSAKDTETNITYPHNASSDSYPELIASALEEGGLDASEALTAFATSEDFLQKLSIAFGDSFTTSKALDFREQWLTSDFRDLPEVKIHTAALLSGAVGAFAQETNTVYLSKDYLEQNAYQPQVITSTLLEEFGHFVDSQLNTSDTPGDEGAIFSALVQGVNLDEAALQVLKAKDDHATIMPDGKVIQIEQAAGDIGNGLRGEYYDNENLTNLKATRTDGTVNFNWGGGSPTSTIAPDTFSARWSGQVLAPTSGSYTFFAQADDGVRLWVNGRQLINDWEDYGAVRERSGTISLTAGQAYDIKLEYFEESGQASAKLLWSGPSVTKQIIPQSQLFSPSLVDETPPTASLTAANITTGGGSVYQFTVNYTDNTAVNIATLDSSDIRISGPNGFSQPAALVSVNTSGNGTPRLATYQIAAPGGIWDGADNGTYTLALQPNQVSDTSSNITPASTLGSFLVSIGALSTGENIVFPADAGVLNVKDFGAKGDGITDDTAAIQAALNAYPNGQRIIYLPNGTYLVSGTLSWPAGTPGTGNDYKNTILQGQSQNGAVIKLKNGAAGFTTVSAPKAVIFTGPAPAQRFGNSIRNLTVDTGMGNAGAIGIQFNASNQGSVRQVTIQSGDGQGVNGLDMSFTDEIGPLLIKGVTVKGFQYGIRTGYNVNSQTLENITLQNQSVYGLYNKGQVVTIRSLTSNNAVTGIYNAGGRVTVLDSTFVGTGAAATKPAIKSDFPLDLMARNITTSGYQTAIQNASATLAGPTITEFVSGGISSLFTSPARTLNLPIKETPDVPWDDPLTTPWANVVSYGAIPNDGKDDTAAIQAAIDSGRTTVYLPVGNYDLQGTVFVRNNVRRITGTEASVQVPNTVNPGFKVVDGTNPVVVIERIQSGFNSTPTIENASSRTLVIRDATNVSGNFTGSGDVFIENVVSNPFQSWTFNRQNVWARQFNVENEGTHITNNGGNLWILGLKTERGGTLIDTKGGGKTEVLGGLAYTTTGGPGGNQSAPMFINSESSVSITLGEVNFGAPTYSTYVRETRGGVTRNLARSSLQNYIASGKQLPLYTGYQ